MKVGRVMVIKLNCAALIDNDYFLGVKMMFIHMLKKAFLEGDKAALWHLRVLAKEILYGILTCLFLYLFLRG